MPLPIIARFAAGGMLRGGGAKGVAVPPLHLSFSVKDDVNDFIRRLGRVQRRQVPFTVAASLTQTAKEAQKEIQAQIPNRFRVTKKWWLQQQPTGIKVKPATKQQWLASVYTEAYFAALQEYGGAKVPFKGSKLVVPSTSVKAAKQRRSGGAREASKQPRVFFGKTQTGRTAMYKRRSKKRVELLYVFTPSAKVKKRFGFEHTAHGVVDKRFQRILEQKLEQALATAR